MTLQTFQSPCGDSTFKLWNNVEEKINDKISFSLLAEIVLLNSTLYKARHNKAKMALCGADFKICIFCLIFTSKSTTNRIMTLAARIGNSLPTHLPQV